MARDFVMVGDVEDSSVDEGGKRSKRESQGRRVLAGAAALVAAAAVCVLVFGRHGGASPVTEAEPGADVVGESAKFPWGYDILENCGVDYKLEEVLHTNLGGLGPDQGEEGILYRASESINHRYIRDVKVWINAVTPYESKSHHKNGMFKDFGRIHVDAGKEVKVRVSIMDMDDIPFTAKTFRMTFYDLDEAPGHTSQEYIIADRHPATLRDDHTQIIREKVDEDLEFEATEIGSAKDNPRDSSDLTQEQKDRSVVLTYHDIKEFHITMGAREGRHPRAFEFALHSALSCHKAKVARTSTTTTATMTMTTTTTTPVAADQKMLAAGVAAGVASAGALGGAAYLIAKKRQEAAMDAWLEGTS